MYIYDCRTVWLINYIYIYTHSYYIALISNLIRDTADIYKEMWSSSRCIPCMVAPATAAWLRERCGWCSGLLVRCVWTCIHYLKLIYICMCLYIYIYTCTHKYTIFLIRDMNWIWYIILWFPVASRSQAQSVGASPWISASRPSPLPVLPKRTRAGARDGDRMMFPGNFLIHGWKCRPIHDSAWKILLFHGDMLWTCTEDAIWMRLNFNHGLQSDLESNTATENPPSSIMSSFSVKTFFFWWGFPATFDDTGGYLVVRGGAQLTRLNSSYAEFRGDVGAVVNWYRSSLLGQPRINEDFLDTINS